MKSVRVIYRGLKNGCLDEFVLLLIDSGRFFSYLPTLHMEYCLSRLVIVAGLEFFGFFSFFDLVYSVVFYF